MICSGRLRRLLAVLVAVFLPSLVVAGDAKATKGLDGSLVATFTRSDGATQVLYNGHALYTYERRGAGIASGAGVKWAGGTWYLVAPSGKAITTTAVGVY